MKHLLKLSLLLLAVLLPASATAYDFEVDGIYYDITDNNSVTVTYKYYYIDYVDHGYIEHYESDYTGDVIIYETVIYNSITYSVTSISDGAFYGCSSLTSVTIPNSITSIGYEAFYNCCGLTSVTIPNSVTSIGEYAFQECHGLTSVTIPNSLTSIGDGAFCGCSGLTSVIIPNSVTSIGYGAFSGCNSITDLSIGNSVTTIGAEAFSGCSSLTSVTIPNSVTSIKGHAFSECTALETLNFNAVFCDDIYIMFEEFDLPFDGTNISTINIGNDVLRIPGNFAYGQTQLSNLIIGNSVTSIGWNAFEGCSGLTSVIIPNSVTEIGSNAFLSCRGLTSVTIPNSVTEIGYGAFCGCSGLTSVNIPNSVTTIGDYAFGSCSGLTSVTIPNSVTSIGYSAFDGCSGLTNVTIPNSVIDIGNYAFQNCSGLMSIIVESGNPTYDSRDNCNALIKTATNMLVAGCMNTIIPNSVTSIGNSAFGYCNGLTSVTIPNSVTEICYGAFEGCSGLTSVTIPNSVIDIGNYAFQNCSGLTSIVVESGNPTYDSRDNCNALIETATNTLITGCMNTTIPYSVTSIGNEAFYGCSGLTNVTIPNSVTSIYYGAFNGCIGLTSVSIPNSVTSIGNYAFSSCSNLNEVYSFITNPSLISIGYSVFDRHPSNYDQRTLYVPIGSVSDYQDNTKWSRYFGSIVEMEATMATSIELDRSSAEMAPGETLQLTAILQPMEATYNEVLWGTSNPAVATVSNEGLVTAVNVGTATITAMTTDGSNLSASCVVTVSPIPVSSITLNKTSVNLSENYTTQLRATVLPDNATDKTVSWISSNSSVATVDNNGLVTAKAPGTANIIAATTDGSNLSATCVVTVISGTDFTFHIDNLEGFAGSTVTIPIELDNNYNVKALMFDFNYPEGFEVIDYSPTDRVSASTDFNGLDQIEEHYFRFVATDFSNNLVLTAGSGPVFNVMLEIPDNASGDYEISLKNIQIAPQEAYNPVFPDDISATLTVKTVPATSVQLNQSSVMLIKGETMQLLASVLPDNATNKAVNWVSNDETVATVDENGLVTALTVGKATITATTVDGTNLSASCEITVKEDLSHYDNYLSLNDVESYPGETIVIPIAMTNTEDIISFQTDIFLPEGLEIVQDDGEYVVDPSSRMTRTHSIICSDVSSGAIRVMCYSSNYKPFTGNSGDDLFYMTVKISDDAMGDYSILLRNTLLTNSDFEEIAAPDVLADVKVKGYLLGDANNSGTVTVTDVVVTSQYVLEQNPQPFIFIAADVNADGNITVTDVSRIAWMVLNPSQNAPRRAPVLWNNGDRMSAEGITLMPGETRTVCIMLDNEMAYSAFQLDLNLPEGLTASNFCLTDRAGSHAFDVNTLANGKTRALCYSPRLTAIRGNKGALLTFDVTATDIVNGFINVDGIELFTTDCQTVRLDDFAIAVNNATTVNEQLAGKSIAKVEYFNIAGQRLNQPESGVTLVVTTYTDGTHSTTKVIR